MASNFPGAIDSFTDPLSNSPLNSPSHSTLHSDINDAVEKVEQYMGLVKVIPTGATNGTVGATGTVTVGNAVSSVTVTNAFSSLYDNYRIIYVGGVGSGSNNLTLRFGSTTTGYYSMLSGVTTAAAATLGYRNNTETALDWCGYATTSFALLEIEIMGASLARPTAVKGSLIQPANSMFVMTGYESSNTQHTSFTILPSGGITLTGGTIRVYGYRN